MTRGYLALVLHAHLPYVRHPEHEHFLEEQWFFEAMTETYIPLVHVFEGLQRDGIDFRLTLSLSPPLVAMMRDPLLIRRYARELDRLVELGHREVERTGGDAALRPLAEMYRDRVTGIRETFRRYEGDLVRAFTPFQDAGVLEIITCNATHMFLPLSDRNWAACHAQIELAAREHERHFGRRPRGMWLAECGYFRGLDELLRESGLRYFFVDSHGVLFADRRPIYGVYAPVYCPTGVAAFGRDVESSKQVWSAQEGYPGDGLYRDFYRDIGFDLDLDYIRPYIHPDGIRHATGFKYHRITSRQTPLHRKALYDPAAARERAAAHAGNFLFNRERQIEFLAEKMDRPPIVVAPYDAELFGHWWFEGPMFLDFLFRKMQYEQQVVAPITPSEYLARHPTNQVATPSASSWGYKGYHEVWLNGSNDWVYRHVHTMGERMVELAHRHPDAQGLRRRALDQAARELLLAQASDWTFIMKTATTTPYAVGRLCDHVNRFNHLYESLLAGTISEPWLAELEARDNIFPQLDYRIYTR
ncbi:MAG: 1,4-alpha-glucan branching protein domain-containing protein [Candidatus Rokuibacteriota bacterium]